MKLPLSILRLQSCLALAVLLLPGIRSGAQPAILWEAYNDHIPTAGVTSPNATGYNMNKPGGDAPLRDFATGEDLAAFLGVTTEGNQGDTFGLNAKVDPGTPAYKLFNGKVDIGNDGIPALRGASFKILLTFGGLDPAKRYRFRGTTSRGGSYNDRWSVYGITGTDIYVPSHEDGSKNRNIITKATFPAAELEVNQVALNSGDNRAGSLVGWNDIAPSADGTFTIEEQQYVGHAPFGTPANAPYGYGFSAIYLAEVEATGNLRITANPATLKAPAGKTATFIVSAESTLPITYQWQRQIGGAGVFLDLIGATSASYTTPSLVVADDGAVYRCQVTSAGDHATTDEATLTVDGIIPTLASVSPSINFNAVFLTFSEAMQLEPLALPENYQLSGGVTLSAVAVLDPTTVRLVTSSLAPATKYTVTIKGVSDLAGNPVQANSTADFTSYSLVKGVAGMEAWTSLLGGGVADLRNYAKYPAEPDVDYSITSLDSLAVYPDGANNVYGGRLRAWLTPAEGGEYEFFLSADDAGEFRLSMEDTFDNIDSPDVTPDAVDTTAGDGFQETGSPATSAVLTLEAGHAYPIQVLWKETNGNDYGRLAWRLVGDPTSASDLQPISGQLLSYYGAAARLSTIALKDGKVIVEWTGSKLESSDDLVTWTEEAGAVTPFILTPLVKKFYRAKQ